MKTMASGRWTWELLTDKIQVSDLLNYLKSQRIMQRLLFLFLPVLLLTACYKDKGNYTYHAINTITLADFRSVKGYTTLYGDTFTLAPAIVSTQNQNSDTAY